MATFGGSPCPRARRGGATVPRTSAKKGWVLQFAMNRRCAQSKTGAGPPPSVAPLPERRRNTIKRLLNGVFGLRSHRLCLVRCPDHNRRDRVGVQLASERRSGGRSPHRPRHHPQPFRLTARPSGRADRLVTVGAPSPPACRRAHPTAAQEVIPEPRQAMGTRATTAADICRVAKIRPLRYRQTARWHGAEIPIRRFRRPNTGNAVRGDSP